MAKKRRIDICVGCGDEAEIAAHGLCYKCYRKVERQAFGQRADWNPGQLRRQKMMAKAYAAMIQALLDFGAGTHTQANKLVEMLGAYLPPLSEYLGDKEPEGEDGTYPNAAAQVSVNRKVGSRSYPEGEDFTDLEEETQTEMNVNDETSSPSHVKAQGEKPDGVNVNKEQSSQSQQPEPEQKVSDPARANVNKEQSAQSQQLGREPSEPATVNVNKVVGSSSEPDEPKAVGHVGGSGNTEESSRSQPGHDAEEPSSVNKHEGSRSQAEPLSQDLEPASVNMTAGESSHSPKDPRYFTKLKERTPNKKEASAVARQKAEAAILNVLGHHDVARMEHFRGDPLLATMTYSKLLDVLNAGVRESKWARRGRTSGASWHLMEFGVNMNPEESSRSQKEIHKTEEPSTGSETAARSARG